MSSKRFILHKLLILLLGQTVFVAAMCGVFALLGHFTWKVLLGGVFGAVLALGNFFFLAAAADRASDQAAGQDPKGGQATIRGSYILRLAVLFGLLFLLAKTGICNLLALILPLAANTPILLVSEFFRKSGDEKP